tara:strand:+ start:508 stop:1002 length:495 start_codon:yes stop_codon:yes gene_type:complete
MKRFLPFVMLLMTAGAANAGGIVSTHSSSVQLTVDAARTQATRIGSSFSISGNGVNTTDGTTAGTVSAGAITSGILNPGDISATQATNGDAFSFNTSYTQGDAVITTSPSTGAVSPFSNQTSTAAGSAGSLAGTIDNAHTITLTAGGAGTSATGQFVTEITVID